MQYSLGLALSGGSAKGFLHIGVLHYLEQIAHTPEIISGTSAGALIAVLYADGFTPLEIAELLTKKGFLGMTNFQIPQGGLFSTHNFHNMLRKNIRHKHLEDLEIPIRVLATDLDKGCSKVFSEGPTVDIVVASCSIPVLFNPVVIDGTYYVDGGLFKNFPVSTIRENCRTVIGVNLGQEPIEGKYKKKVSAIAQRSFSFIFGQNARPDRELCDILIEIDPETNVPMFNLSLAPKLVKKGFEMAREKINDYNAHRSETGTGI